MKTILTFVFAVTLITNAVFGQGAGVPNLFNYDVNWYNSGKDVLAISYVNLAGGKSVDSLKTRVTVKVFKAFVDSLGNEDVVLLSELSKDAENGKTTDLYFQNLFEKDSAYVMIVFLNNDSGTFQMRFDVISTRNGSNISEYPLSISKVIESAILIQNPAHSTCAVTSEVPLTKAVVMDMMGRVIIEEGISSSSSNYTLNTNALPTGIYLVSLFDNGNRLVTKRILKE